MKKCNHDNCTNPVFSHGICKYHYRYASKVKAHKVHTGINDSKPETFSQSELFKKIWETRPHYSELSGQPLDNIINIPYYWVWCFAHILPKGKYPMFKFEEENIVLVSPEEHRLIDFGTFDERMDYNKKARYPANWDIFYQRKEYLKVKYQEQLKQLL